MTPKEPIVVVFHYLTKQWEGLDARVLRFLKIDDNYFRWGGWNPMFSGQLY